MKLNVLTVVSPCIKSLLKGTGYSDSAEGVSTETIWGNVVTYRTIWGECGNVTYRTIWALGASMVKYRTIWGECGNISDYLGAVVPLW